MRYLMMIKHEEKYRNAEIPQSLMDAMGKLIEEGFKTGKLKETAGLKPSKEGFQVRNQSGKLSVTDGPFTEAKELVGGYALFDLASKDEALQVARDFMELHRVHWPAFDGVCEVRPLEEM
ncbi:MAG TPA: YciI family protein [Candidatus Krumholzibacteria bacterium]|nr:YciI family protein [Candidatus Krumholzibacteria bacterium]